MSQGLVKSRLITNRFAAAIGLLSTGVVATQSIRIALIHAARHPHWLFPLPFIRSQWALLAVNVAFYGYVLWLCFVFFRIAQGKERVVVFGWFFGIALYPIKALVSGPVVLAVQYAEAAAMAVAFLAVLDIFLRFFVRTNPEIQS